MYSLREYVYVLYASACYMHGYLDDFYGYDKYPNPFALPDKIYEIDGENCGKRRERKENIFPCDPRITKLPNSGSASLISERDFHE